MINQFKKIQQPTNFLRKRLVGFSLVELMFSLAIVGILFSFALPSFMETIDNNRIKSLTNNLISSIFLARSEAIKSNGVVVLCASSGGVSCESTAWRNGWIVLNGAKVVSKQTSIPAGYLITELNGISAINFQANGLGATAASLKVCKSVPVASKQSRTLTVNYIGKPSAALANNTGC